MKGPTHIIWRHASYFGGSGTEPPDLNFFGADSILILYPYLLRGILGILYWETTLGYKGFLFSRYEIFFNPRILSSMRALRSADLFYNLYFSLPRIVKLAATADVRLAPKLVKICVFAVVFDLEFYSNPNTEFSCCLLRKNSWIKTYMY